MLGKIVLSHMHEDERTVAYVANRCGITARRMIDLLCGEAQPTADELGELARVTGAPVEDLQRAADTKTSITPIDPLHCYTVAEAARLLGIGPDTLRKEIRAGTLGHVLLGENATRVPRWAIEERQRRDGSGRPNRPAPGTSAGSGRTSPPDVPAPSPAGRTNRSSAPTRPERPLF